MIVKELFLWDFHLTGSHFTAIKRSKIVVRHKRDLSRTGRNVRQTCRCCVWITICPGRYNTTSLNRLLKRPETKNIGIADEERSNRAIQVVATLFPDANLILTLQLHFEGTRPCLCSQNCFRIG